MRKNTKKNRKTSSIRKITKTSSKKAGLPPGTIVYIGENRESKSEIDIFNYSEKIFNEREIDTFDACLKYLNNETITWVNIEGIHNIDIIKSLGKEFNINNLVLEDMANTNQRAKISEFSGYIYIILKNLSLGI